MATKAITKVDFIVDKDASLTFESIVMNMIHPLQSLSYQFVWDVGVVGIVDFYASIYPPPYKWEALVSCSNVCFNTADSATESEIISIPGLWLTAGYIKFIFTPDAGGSTGNMNVAQRVVPT